MQLDTLIHADWIAPVEPTDTVLEQHSLGIANGRVQVLLPTTQAREQLTAEEIIELPGQVLIPGLVNAHTHASMSLFRGLADDLPLMTWLNDHIWPAEGRWVHEDFVASGTRLAVAEMLRGGTTCFNDMYFFPDVTGRVAAQAGIRANVGLIVIAFPSAWAQDLDGYFQRASEVHDLFRDNPLVNTLFAPHSPYAVTDEAFARIRKLGSELDLNVHMHVHETADEVAQSLREHGKRPLQRLHDLGLLDPSLLAVHMTQLSDAEIDSFAASGASVAHCPESNLKLASGFCPVAHLLDTGINVALGTDGAASNNDLDMIGEMRSAALLGKGVAQSASALPAPRVLEMATLNGARALGLDEHIGSLTVGKAADIVAVDLNRLQTQPVYNPVSQLVYAASREQVSNVWVGGRRLLRDGHLTTLDQEAILKDAGYWRDRIQSKDESPSGDSA